MKLRKFTVSAAAAALSLVIPGLSIASENTPPAPEAKPAAAPAAKGKLDEIVCRGMQVTGSHVQRERVCMTRREWEMMTRDAQEEFHYIRERDNITPPNPAGASALGGH